MAVLPMEHISLCAMKRDRKKILELLQRRGIVEVRAGNGEDEVFAKTDTSAQRAIFLKNADLAQDALEILDKAAPPEGTGLAFLKGRKAVTIADNDAFSAKRETVLKKVQRIVQLKREETEAKADIVRAEAAEEALAPWMNLPVAQTFLGTRKTAAFIGALEGERTLEMVLEELAPAGIDPMHAEIVSSDKSQTCILALVLKKDAERTEEALRALGFVRPPSASHHAPAEKKRRLEAQKAKALETIAKAEDEIKGFAGDRADILYFIDHMKMRAEKYEVLGRLSQSKHVFVLTGYVPAGVGHALEMELCGHFECSVERMPAEAPGGDVPVLLSNRWFTAPLEGVLESYSPPGKGELDPTSIMAIFYYVMFGLMFSDAGYGLIMFGVCLFCLLRFKNMEPNWSKNIRLFMWCGLSTIIWGVVFSSYFGDVVDVISGTFLGNKVSIPPLWFLPMEKPMLLLVFCLGIGTVHLTVGYILKAVTCVKNGDVPGAIFDGVVPLLAWYPLVLMLTGSDMFLGLAGFKLNLPPATTNVCLGIAGVGVVAMLLTGGRESKNWFKRLLKGAYAVYNLLSGWLSDTLSYSRLLALGLATGVIAGVMNQMGSMVGPNVPGVIVFILVFAAGHAINFGINVLGAYVHSNRLEYVEFFGKFYDGGGVKFAPFGIHTKHYKIIEEDIKQ